MSSDQEKLNSASSQSGEKTEHKNSDAHPLRVDVERTRYKTLDERSIQSHRLFEKLPLKSKKHEPISNPLIPARMVNEFVYCPRLAYLEWVQKEWEDSVDTVEGGFAHKRVDKRDTAIKSESTSSTEPTVARSVEVGSEKLGLTAKIDLLQIENDLAVPVEYKKGKRPHIKHNAWDPDRVQVCVQGLLLREHGLKSEYGVLYYAGSRERVIVPFDVDLIKLTNESVESFRESVRSGELPMPLTDSPKCPRCSLVGICLPDEVNVLKTIKEKIRPIAIKRTTAYPLYIQSHQCKVSKEGYELIVTSGRGEEEEINKVRLSEVSQLAIFGNAYITTPVMHELLRRGIPVCWYTYGGWFLGHSMGSFGGNVELRTMQFKNAEDTNVCQRIACGLIEAKIKNSRVFLMRNCRTRGSNQTRAALKELKSLANTAMKADTLNELLGIEGYAAAIYFKNFDSMFQKEINKGFLESFSFETRNRRPPLDPINAMLSFGYALLVRQISVALMATGLDPYKGFMHQGRFGRPSLALDLMEPFRPLVVDSTVLTMINNGEVNQDGFVARAGAVAMKDSTRKKYIATFERRLSQEITHPVFNYKIEYRRLFELQARLLGRYLLGDIPDYPNLVVR